MRLSAVVHADEALDALEGVADRAQDLSPAWDRVLPQLRRAEQAIFLTRGHGQWPANAASTARKKGSDRPMFDTGRLFRALAMDRQRGGVARKARTQLTFGVNDSSIFWARFVGKRRPFIVSDDRAAEIGAKAVRDWLDGGVR